MNKKRVKLLGVFLIIALLVPILFNTVFATESPRNQETVARDTRELEELMESIKAIEQYILDISYENRSRGVQIFSVREV